jgi:hypothetical protein
MTFLTPRAFCNTAISLLIVFSLPGSAWGQSGVDQPRMTGIRPYSNSVILQGGTHAQTMQRLHVVRQYGFQNLRSNPRVMLGEVQLDFQPILNNRMALPNLAGRLQAMPQHVQVKESTTEVTEVDQGMVIHHVLTYQILPGKCADAGAKAMLAEAGVTCFSRGTANQRMAEFSTPGSARYIANPGKRQLAMEAFQQKSAAADEEASQHIAELRKMLADPAQRAQIAASVGRAEAARMSALSDDDLKDELINMGAQTVEETMFVPKLETANYAHPKDNLAINAGASEIAAVQGLMRNGVSGESGPAGFPKLLRIIPGSALHLVGSTAPGGDKTAHLDMGPYIFLTGFTIGMITNGNGACQSASTGALLAVRPLTAFNCTPDSTMRLGFVSPFKPTLCMKPSYTRTIQPKPS